MPHPGSPDHVATSRQPLGEYAPPGARPGLTFQIGGEVYFDTSIEMMGFSTLTAALLIANGISSLRKLLLRTEQQLLAIPGFGALSLASVKKEIAARGLTLGPWVDPARPYEAGERVWYLPHALSRMPVAAVVMLDTGAEVTIEEVPFTGEYGLTASDGATLRQGHRAVERPRLFRDFARAMASWWEACNQYTVDPTEPRTEDLSFLLIQGAVRRGQEAALLALMRERTDIFGTEQACGA